MSDEILGNLSQLSQEISSDGKSVQVEIYENGEGGWILETIDEFNNSTVWDDTFTTDSAALAEAKKVISEEGIDSLIGPASGKGEW
jgi:uncharacterized protein